MTDGSGPSADRPAAATRAYGATVDRARDEVERLVTGLQPTISALSSIDRHTRSGSNDSALLRASGLESLPRGYYVEHCLGRLRYDLSRARTPRQAALLVADRLDEIETMLRSAIELTARIDVPGHLGVSPRLVGVLQTESRAGLATIARLRDELSGAAGDESSGAEEQEWAGSRPSRSAQLVLDVATRVLPASSQERYAEEFGGELLQLADAGSGRIQQLAHALRLFARIWALRKAIPGDSAAGVASYRVQRQVGTSPPRVRPRMRDRTVDAIIGSRLQFWWIRRSNKSRERTRRNQPPLRFREGDRVISQRDRDLGVSDGGPGMGRHRAEVRPEERRVPTVQRTATERLAGQLLPTLNLWRVRRENRQRQAALRKARRVRNRPGPRISMP